MISSGSSGIVSLKNAIDYLKSKYSPDDTIIIQESTRPMVNVETISKLLQACAETGSATISHTMNEYVQFKVCKHDFDEDNITAHTIANHNHSPFNPTHTSKCNVQYLNRDSIVALQSPEAHRLSLLLDVFDQAKEQQHPLIESCCTMLMYHLGYNINFTEGGLNNIKIIDEEDLKMFSALVSVQNHTY